MKSTAADVRQYLVDLCTVRFTEKKAASSQSRINSVFLVFEQYDTLQLIHCKTAALLAQNTMSASGGLSFLMV
jgi:hypothetical protein